MRRPNSTCTCDYCSGRKNPREWCARCGKVRLRPDQNGFENLDVCDPCRECVRREALLERLRMESA